MSRLPSQALSASTSPLRHAGLRAPAPRFAVVSLICRLIALPFASAVPIGSGYFKTFAEEAPKSTDNPQLWAYLGTAVALVLLGGAFAGLTIALMGQDEIYLQVIATSGEAHERKHAKKVLRLLKKGKHWVLVTLLLSNVITNETLPIVLDRSLGGGWPAVLSSTVLIVIFGEIAPQSVCVRYGLPIGAWMSPFVEILMWIMSPVAWPTAKLLDYLLGEDHGTTYKKAGLKTLVTLHKTLGQSPDERLNQDEVTIISAVLDLKDKPVGNIMTPMDDVFTLSADAVLDEKMMDEILGQGYSRIPVHRPGNETDFLGMLLVKMLITYDPEDGLKVRDFALATLPETSPETSCLDIINFFQEGKSHMVLVSESPGEPRGALGVVTLEDVIEEVIGEYDFSLQSQPANSLPLREIIDESDVYIDVHKSIRRLAPAPRLRVSKGTKGLIITDGSEVEGQENESRKGSFSELSRSPTARTFMMRRRSSDRSPIPVRGPTPEMRERLKRLGPSNVASRPKQTRISAVKIKPGVDTIPETEAVGPKLVEIERSASRAQSFSESIVYKDRSNGEGAGVGEGLLASAGKDASDAAHVVSQGYGTMSNSWQARHQDFLEGANGSTVLSPGEQDGEAPKDSVETPLPEPDKIVIGDRPEAARNKSDSSSTHSHSTVRSLPRNEERDNKPARKESVTKARSGSITENLIASGGARKIVLETTSSSDDAQGSSADGNDAGDGSAGGVEVGGGADGAADGEAPKHKKTRRKKRAGKKKGKGNGNGGHGESEPLLGGGR